jgi:uncharacterized protein YbaR (Trm112 family)
MLIFFMNYYLKRKRFIAIITKYCCMKFDVNNSNLCPLCLHDGQSIRLELTESMLLVCKRCSRAFEVKSNGKRILSDEMNQ